MINKIRKLINQHAIENQIEVQQALKFLISDIKSICISLNLDFESALDKSDPTVDFLDNGCDHKDAYPCNYDKVYCPRCEQYLIEGKSPLAIDWVKQNHWRETPVVPPLQE